MGIIIVNIFTSLGINLLGLKYFQLKWNRAQCVQFFDWIVKLWIFVHWSVYSSIILESEGMQTFFESQLDQNKVDNQYFLRDFRYILDQIFIQL